MMFSLISNKLGLGRPTLIAVHCGPKGKLLETNAILDDWSVLLHAQLSVTKQRD